MRQLPFPVASSKGISLFVLLHIVHCDICSQLGGYLTYETYCHPFSLAVQWLTSYDIYEYVWVCV